MSICSHNTFIINVIIGIVNNENIVDIATTFAPYLLSKFIFATNNIVDAAEGHEQAIIVAKDTISPSPNSSKVPLDAPSPTSMVPISSSNRLKHSMLLMSTAVIVPNLPKDRR